MHITVASHTHTYMRAHQAHRAEGFRGAAHTSDAKRADGANKLRSYRMRAHKAKSMCAAMRTGGVHTANQFRDRRVLQDTHTHNRDATFCHPFDGRRITL